jgi:predicted extracellular nuclease
MSHPILQSAFLSFVLASVPAAAAPAIVISQVYGGGGNSGATLTNDFIELHNAGGASVDVTGWSVQYASASGTTWQVTTLRGTIEPGGYYLVQEAKGNGGTQPLPAPDATGSIAMACRAGSGAGWQARRAWLGAAWKAG